MKKKLLSIKATAYKTNNPKKAETIDRAVKRALKQYAETFRRLASS